MGIEISTLKMFSTACDQASEDDVRRALQAVIEKKNHGESSLDDKIVAEFEGVGFTEANFRETIRISGQIMTRHRNGGGWVPLAQSATDGTKPFVAKRVYVGPFARVLDAARVGGGAVITDYACVKGRARVEDQTHVSDMAIVKENARVSRTARIGGHAHVTDQAEVRGFTAIDGNAIICNFAKAEDSSWITGYAHLGGDAYTLGIETLRHGICNTRKQVEAAKQ